ncbi:hypothetical protein O181_061508 [Austropuccinia psidii MF-1]|uniref:Reverse transcriptase Ty1/copia-type domain-containing protein n=1 Tax=Austropuccinia psidii MF-1 TaxID=1389203 RepID=A0A9Q3EI65_9BASI|nr:hypothetical protein [Austropuccinia psidii MF-1]
MVHEVHVDGEGPLSSEAVTAPTTLACIQVMGPHHPTLVLSDINNLNIPPYRRRETLFLSLEIYTPGPYKGALNAPDKDLWLEAISKEVQSLENLNTWEVVEKQGNFRLFGTTWVFRLKKNHSKKVIEYKERLCAQGFT